MMHITGEKEGRPNKVGVAVADVSLQDCTPSLRSRLHCGIETEPGIGQHIDMSLLDTRRPPSWPTKLSIILRQVGLPLPHGERPPEYRSLSRLRGFGRIYRHCDRKRRPIPTHVPCSWARGFDRVIRDFIDNTARVKNRAELVPLIEAANPRKHTRAELLHAGWKKRWCLQGRLTMWPRL